MFPVTFAFAAVGALAGISVASPLSNQTIDAAGGGIQTNQLPNEISEGAATELQLAHFLENLEAAFFETWATSSSSSGSVNGLGNTGAPTQAFSNSSTPIASPNGASGVNGTPLVQSTPVGTPLAGSTPSSGSTDSGIPSGAFTSESGGETTSRSLGVSSIGIASNGGTIGSHATNGAPFAGNTPSTGSAFSSHSSISGQFPSNTVTSGSFPSPSSGGTFSSGVFSNESSTSNNGFNGSAATASAFSGSVTPSVVASIGNGDSSFPSSAAGNASFANNSVTIVNSAGDGPTSAIATNTSPTGVVAAGTSLLGISLSNISPPTPIGTNFPTPSSSVSNTLRTRATDGGSAGLMEMVQTIAAQEQVHLANTASLLAAYGLEPVAPCQYSFPASSTEEFLELARLITPVGVGAMVGLIERLSITDPFLTGFVSSVLAVESRHDAFFRSVEGLVPNPAPFDTGISDVWAYNLALPFIVPGSCSNEIPLPILPRLNISEAQSTSEQGQNLTQWDLSWDSDQVAFVTEAGKQLFVGWVNQLNQPTYTPLNLTSPNTGTALSPSGLNGAAFAVVAAQEYDTLYDLTRATMAGPVIVPSS